MVKLELLALELFEYKVADINALREVRGGISSVYELYNLLLREIRTLDPEAKQRFEEAASTLRSLNETPRKSKKLTDTFTNLVVGDLPDIPEITDEETRDQTPAVTGFVASDPEVMEEQAVLQRLAQRVWWQDLEDLVQRVAAGWRAERERYTARLVFGTLRNLNAYAAQEGRPPDPELTFFEVTQPIPQRSDALVSLNDLDSLAEIVRELINAIMTTVKQTSPYARLEIPEARALELFRRAALAVAADPYAGDRSLIPLKGPSSKQLRLAIQEIAKERLSESEKRNQRLELEARLTTTLANERNQRQMFQHDVSRFADLVNAFFDRLARYLPGSVGGQASGPQLQGGVLFAANPALRWDKVPAGAQALTVNLRGPVRFSLAGTEIGVMGSGLTRSLFVANKEFTLAPRMTIQVGRRKLLVFQEGNYLHLKIRDEARSLAVMVAEALAVFYVLGSPARDDLMTVLKIAANSVVGEPKELVAAALARIGTVSAKAPSRPQAIEGLVRGSAKAAGVELPPDVVAGLVERFHTAMTVGPTDLSGVLEKADPSDSAVYQLSGEPLSIDLAGYKLTVRQYRGRDRDAQESLVVMLPGQVLGSFTDYLLEPLDNGTLICVRGEQEVALMYLTPVAIQSSRAV